MKSARGLGFFFTELYYRKLNLTSTTRGMKLDTAMWKATKHANRSPQINDYKILIINLFYLRVRKS